MACLLTQIRREIGALGELLLAQLNNTMQSHRPPSGCLTGIRAHDNIVQRQDAVERQFGPSSVGPWAN